MLKNLNLIGLFALLVAAVVLSGCASSLHKAAWKGDTKDVRRLIDEGADINNRGEIFPYGVIGSLAPLNWAAMRGHTDTVRLLLDEGADVNSKDSHGQTSLMFAAFNGYGEIVELLLEKGANIGDSTAWGTALDAARRNNHLEIVEYIEALVLKQMRGLPLEELLKKHPFNNETFVSALTEKLIDSKNIELPRLLLEASFDQKEELLNLIEKRQVQAQVKIEQCKNEAESFIRQENEAKVNEYRNLSVSIMAYQAALKSIKAELAEE